MNTHTKDWKHGMPIGLWKNKQGETIPVIIFGHVDTQCDHKIQVCKLTAQSPMYCFRIKEADLLTEKQVLINTEAKRNKRQ